MKSVSTNSRNRVPFARPTLGLTAALALLLCLPLSATVLDNFDGVKTGWTDTLNGGTIVQSGGQFRVATATASGSLTSSRKTSASFAPAAGHTLEFRVDVGTVTPGAGNVNPQAILAWVPTGGAVLANGYSLTLGVGNIRIQKGSAVLYSTTTVIHNTNVTMVLRLTPSGSSMSVNARIYRQGNGNDTLLFGQTVTDGAGLTGGGNAALGVLNVASASGATVAYDNLQVFDIVNTVLDNFSGAHLPFWYDILNGGTVTQTGGTCEYKTMAVATTIFTGGFNATKTFAIVDGSRLEFRIDVVSNPNGEGSYSALGYLPGTAGIGSLKAYHIAHDTTQLVVGKEYNRWWGQGPAGLPTGNLRYVLTFTGEGTSVRTDSRLEDLGYPVNDPNRVKFQNVFVDTAGSDFAGDSGAAYLNANGYFYLLAFNAGTPFGADVTYDNAEVSQTIPGNTAPIVGNLNPADGSNFVASASTVSFTAIDDGDMPAENLVLTLNGVRYTNGSPGVSITGTSQNRLFTLAGALSPNVNCVGTITATDNQGAATVAPYNFDTFLTNNLVVESEEWNFGGGLFIDNPKLLGEGWTDPEAYNGPYNGQEGIAEVDFHDNRTSGGGYPSQNHAFRSDPPYTARTGDPARAKYILAGGPDLGFYEDIVVEIRNGDWLNYTHTYPAGTYNVFMRHAVYVTPQAVVTLERVTSDRTQPNQTTALLGAFLGTATGYDIHRNTQLTDGLGNPVVVRFSGGVGTLRITNRDVEAEDFEYFQNYMVFVPAADPGTLRPIVAFVTPAANSTAATAFPTTSATIVNRDTTVVTSPGAIQLLINGSAVGATVTPTATGAQVSGTLATLPPPGSLVTNTLSFADSDGVSQTNTWTWTITYPYLRASNSLPVGALTVRGWDYRMVQTNGPTLGNSLARAEQQLAIPPEIPYEVTTNMTIQTLNWDKMSTTIPVPGLDPGNWNNIAVECFAYLELTAGVHRFHVVTDDRAGFYSGASLKDPNPVVLWEAPGNTANTTFDFVAEAAGLYPVRCLWEETGGGANFYVYSVNLGGGPEYLVNDPANPAGVVKVYLPGVPTLVLSSAAVSGPYTVAGGAVINPVTKTVTVPRSASTQFYRMQAATALTIKTITLSGPNVVITYQ